MSKMKKKKAAPSKRAPEQPRLKRAEPFASTAQEAIEKLAVKIEDAIKEDELQPELPGVPVPEERKSWSLKTMSDFAKLPRDQFPYAIYYTKFELNKALMLGYAIDYFVWHEGGKLETFKIEASALD